MVQAAQAGTSVAAALTVKSVEQLAGSGTRFAYAVKAGPWIFLNGHEAFDFERGLAGEVEGPVGSRLSGRPPLRREADYILQRMRSTLKEFRCDLANAVRVDQYYTSGQAVHAYHLARFAEFGGYIPPSTSIIMPRCFTARTNIHTSMIAVVPGSNWTIEKISLPGEAISASGYSPAVVVDDFVFVAGNQAFVESGELGPGVAIAPARNWGGENAFRRQAHYVIKERLEPSLKAAGSALEQQPQGAGLHPRGRQLPGLHGRVVAVFPQHSVRGDAGAGTGLFQHREHARDQPDRAQDRRGAQEGGGRRRHSRARDLRALPARGRIGLPVRSDGGYARRARPRRRQRGGLRRPRPGRIRPGRLAPRLRAGGLRRRRRLHGQRRARAVLPDRYARFRRRRRRLVAPLWK